MPLNNRSVLGGLSRLANEKLPERPKQQSLLEELRALGDDAQEQRTIEFGETARKLHAEGFFDNLVSQQQGERAAAEVGAYVKSAFSTSEAQSWLMNPAAQVMLRAKMRPVLTGELGEFWKGVARGVGGSRAAAGHGLVQYGQTLNSPALRDYGSQLAREGERIHRSKLFEPAIADYTQIGKPRPGDDIVRKLAVETSVEEGEVTLEPADGGAGEE